MDQLIWILALTFAFILAPLALWSRRRRRRRAGSPRVGNLQAAAAREAIVPAPSPASERSTSSATRRLRRRGGGAAGASSSSASVSAIVPAPEIEAEAEEEGEEAEVREVATYYVPKQSKKKNEKKQEREARREAEAYARDVRRDKQDRQSEMRRRKDEEREAEDRKKEEEAEKLKVREEAAAAAEFDKWKTAFSVETEGTQEEDSQQEGQGLVNDFVHYIKTHKCVALEDLAGEFNLKTQDCIDRVVALEQMGRISGVMDDRGKYIYISPEEMKAVADYIKRLGRVSIAHLANRSNEFIDLEIKSLATDCAQEATVDDGTAPADSVLSGPQMAC